MRTGIRYSRAIAAPKPPAIDERSWRIFTDFRHKEHSLDAIARTYQLSPEQVRRIVAEVEAQLGRNVEGSALQVALESPVEELGLSVRTRNALRAVGCKTVEDALQLDLTSNIRGLGSKTKTELLSRLERAGFDHPSLEAQPGTEIRVLERRLERMQARLERALGMISDEIRLVKKGLQKTLIRRPRS